MADAGDSWNAIVRDLPGAERGRADVGVKMKESHRFFLLLKKPEERTEFLNIGVELPSGKNTDAGELVCFEISEQDERWGPFASLMERRMIADAADARTIFEKSSIPRTQASWLDGYSGESLEALLSMDGRYRTDSVVVALEEALLKKSSRGQSLTPEERVVLVVEALEREVNNGGYSQFFTNSAEFISEIAESLEKIGCGRTAEITRRAIEAVAHANGTGMATRIGEDATEKLLGGCDKAYFEANEPIAERLFGFIRSNKSRFNLDNVTEC